MSSLERRSGARPAALFVVGAAIYVALLWLANEADLAHCVTQIAGHC